MERYPSIDNQKYMDEDMWRLKIYDEDIEYTNQYKTIDLLYENTPQYFIDTYLDILSNLEFISTISQYVSKFTDGWDDMVGLHFRSWYCSKQVFHSNEIFE